MVALDLQRAMLDPEAMQNGLSPGEELVRLARTRRDDVGGERGLGRAQRPDVKVMDGLDPVEFG